MFKNICNLLQGISHCYYDVQKGLNVMELTGEFYFVQGNAPKQLRKNVIILFHKMEPHGVNLCGFYLVFVYESLTNYIWWRSDGLKFQKKLRQRLL